MKTKQEKREEAEVRQKEYNDLTVEQKLSKTLTRRGDSIREKKRLNKILNKKNKKEKNKKEKKKDV